MDGASQLSKEAKDDNKKFVATLKASIGANDAEPAEAIPKQSHGLNLSTELKQDLKLASRLSVDQPELEQNNPSILDRSEAITAAKTFNYSREGRNVTTD